MKIFSIQLNLLLDGISHAQFSMWLRPLVVLPELTNSPYMLVFVAENNLAFPPQQLHPVRFYVSDCFHT